jgi:uncharacterized protein YqeY
MSGADDVRGRLAAALNQALRDRDTSSVAGLRSALAAVANAEAIDVTPAEIGEYPRGREGVGAGEAPRRELTPGDVVAIVEREIGERETAAAEYDQLGRTDDAARLRRTAATLRELDEG